MGCAQARMNPRCICRRSVGEARHRSYSVSQPTWSRRTGILHKARPDGMLKRPLRFAVVIEAELIHGAVVDRPVMRDVPLLESFAGCRSESGNVCPGGL